MGGLGNMMFQIAFGESIAKKYGCDVVYTNLKENFQYIKSNYTRSPHADEYLSLFPNIKWDKNHNRIKELTKHKHVPFHYVDITPEDETEYIGYFQSEKYFYSEEFIRSLFLFSHTIERKYEFPLNITASIHVRRSDYVSLPDHHPPCDMVYYQSAIDVLDREDLNKYIIFSDDIDWCKNNFSGDRFVFSHDKDYIDLFNMTYCDHNIIANSSLSWWGAYLNPSPYKIVIAPQRWFGNACKDNPRDIIPGTWLKI